MRFFLLTLFLVFSNKILSQKLIIYNDTVNHFSIGLPEGWTYKTNYDANVKLIVFRAKETDSDNPRETYNINIFPFPDSNIDSANASMIRSIKTRQGYKLINQGDTTIDGKRYKWTLENHLNIKTQEEMTAYIYLAYYNNKAYMTTFATIALYFKKYEQLFKSISWTFKL